MSELSQYILKHTTRVPAGSGTNAVNVAFFDVQVSDAADRDVLCDLISKHKGAFVDVEPFDGNEHGFIELGAWLGDQGTALAFIGMGAHMELWRLLSPQTVLGDMISAEQALAMAHQGMVTLQAIKG